MSAADRIQELVAENKRLTERLEKVQEKSKRRRTALKQTNAAITALRLAHELNMGTIDRLHHEIRMLKNPDRGVRFG